MSTPNEDPEPRHTPEGPTHAEGTGNGTAETGGTGEDTQARRAAEEAADVLAHGAAARSVRRVRRSRHAPGVTVYGTDNGYVTVFPPTERTEEG
ncbi:hypothetical protein [Leucobacter sp. M11]|uniref:hypothetical protein n=1 Tax=Leucobacter sp. M11 TaxID=2993565 RepID=UPI002D7E3948|nr:hypothetical protein [Leucobacter sp. M11]MEB4614611.1 hypothetical protein [Leucobacter sp. M11]